MPRKLVVLSLLALMALPSLSCRIRASGAIVVPIPSVRVEADVTPPPPPPTAGVRIDVTPPELYAGVSTITPSCTPGAPEVLNGLDDNCDGRVDEGFVQSGAVQVSLGWSTGADIDLYLTDPFGETISYSHRDSSSGGHLDRDARGACTNGQTTENIYFPAGTAPRGTYQVAVHYFSDCRAAASTRVVLSIMVGGQALGVYQFDLVPEQRITMATFTIP